uniref:Uncharacterized protein n=1 Tax=uncultured marine virus TaxID=186617 RepID=A0A0F7L4E0_9VIRU|nr:hypothetical protein [uncultured marine virus]
MNLQYQLFHLHHHHLHRVLLVLQWLGQVVSHKYNLVFLQHHQLLLLKLMGR